MTRLRLLALGLLLSFAGATALPAPPRPAGSAAWVQDPADLKPLLAERAGAAASYQDDELWEEVAVLSALVRDLAPGEADRAVDGLLERSAEFGDAGTLLLVAVRLAGDEPGLDALAARLGELLASPREDVARGAAGLLADRRFNPLGYDQLKELLGTLLSGAKDASREPATRMEFAVTAWMRGASREKREARGEMRAFLDSTSQRLRSLAAIALARINDFESARFELERLAGLPGSTGQLAASYLKNDWQVEYFEGRLRQQRQRVQEVLDERVEKPADDLALVERLIRIVQARHIEGEVLQRKDLIDAALDGILRSLDQHSGYMRSEDYERFEQDLEGEYGGIGAYVQEDPNDHLFTITRPIYSGPAYKANLRSDDKIVQIDDWPTIEGGRSKPTDDIIRRLKGKPGTQVKLYVWRQGMDPTQITRPNEDMAVVVTRAQITIPPIRADVLPGDVGLVELITFSGVASQQLGLVLQSMVQGGVRGIVLDLRNNSGGLLQQGQAVSDMFLERSKLIVSTEERTRSEQFRAERDPIVPKDVPVVVLMNRFSASAAEIVAGALQDNGRAILVGERSYGKGSVQNLIPLGPDDEYDDQNGNGRHDDWEPLTKDHNRNGRFDFAPRAKLTIARWLVPSGRSIHRELDEEGNLVSLGGVRPDHEVQARRWDAWRLEEMVKIARERKLREWVAEQWEEHGELLKVLAHTDGKDPARYPGFQELYESLGTVLPPEDVRYLVRSEVRRRAQDERGAEFPQGDYQEDVQLQKAIEVLLEQLGRAPEEFDPYLLTFESIGERAERSLSGAVAESRPATDRREVREALALLARASRGDAELTPENIARLRALLSTLDH